MRGRALVILVFVALASHAGERGLPLVRAFTPEDFHAGAQNFAIAQDGRGVLWFGNLKGALSFDGAWWDVVELPKHSAVFALATDSKGRIIAGGVGTLGIIENQQFHELKADRPIGDVSAICRDGDGFIAVTDRLALAGNANGVHVDNTKRCSREPVPGVAWLNGKHVVDAVRLHDGRLAVATAEDGVAIFTRDGQLDQVLDHTAGVPDDVIRAAFVDRDGSLWLAAADGSVAQIDLSSPLTVWDSRLGIRGAARQVFRWNDRIYITNSHGLFAIDRERAPVRRVWGSNASWFMLEVPDGVLVSTSNGIFVLDRSEHATLIAGTERTGGYGMLRPTFDPSRVYFGCRTGLGVLRRDAAGWKLERMIDGAPPYVRDLLEENGTIWASTTFNGALRIDVRQALSLSSSSGQAESLSYTLTRMGDGETFITTIDGHVAFNFNLGERFMRVEGSKLVDDQRIERLQIPGHYFRIEQDSRGNLWANTIPPRMFRVAQTLLSVQQKTAQTGVSGQHNWSPEGEPLQSIAVTDIQSITCEPDGVVWLGTNRGMFRWDANAVATAAPQPAPIIHRSIAARRRLRIEFAPVSYRAGVSYQYRLDPIDSDWSAWSNETFVDFTNLGGGDYTLRVRARAPEGAVSPETRWVFHVQPPWYATRTAFALWVVALAALIMLIVRIRTSALHRQAETLRERIADRTRALNEKNELLLQANARLERLSFFDELTGIANRRYFQRLIGEDWQNAMRDRSSLALIMIDLDHFKQLNDTRGHRAGDESLKRIGEFLGSMIRRSGDVAARYGGEEFAVLLVGAGEADAMQIAERLRVGIADLGIPYDDGGTRFLTTSCGVAATVPSARAVPDTLIDMADQALYAAKNAGRNCVIACESLTSQPK
jgi:diguanylate cyclase (GGDEF)-like protein